MTTAFLTYAVPPTGATASRTLPAQLADDVNVKDFGAVGDGVANDTAAIQAAFNVAFGTVAAPHGNDDRFLNKKVIFPAGRYNVSTTLEIRSLHGGWIVGAGIGATRLIWTGSVPGGATRTKLLHTNGYKQCRVESISFEMTGANTLANNTVCFDLNWDGTGSVGTAHNSFHNCLFSGATYGLLIGDDDFQSDTTYVVNCNFDNCYYGLIATNFNALGSGVFGGSFSNNHTGIYMPSGVMGIVSGVSFSGSANVNDNDTGDIVSHTGTPIIVIGCHSTSPQFLNLPGQGLHHVVGCVHDSSTAAPFLRLGGTAVLVENCRSTKGYLQNGTVFANNLVFDTPDWTHTSSAICEWTSATPFTYATLPGNSSWWAEGLIMSITDATTATWGANVTTGGGSNHVSIRWNGSNWTVVGA